MEWIALPSTTRGALFLIAVALSAFIPLVSLVQGIGQARQLKVLMALSNYPVGQSQYFMIALNYFKNMEPFAITSARYAAPVTMLFVVSLACAGVTYLGAQWSEY